MDAKVMELLREVEWHFRRDPSKEFCSWCYGLKSRGHAEGCELAALLAQGRDDWERDGILAWLGGPCVNIPRTRHGAVRLQDVVTALALKVRALEEWVLEIERGDG